MKTGYAHSKPRYRDREEMSAILCRVLVKDRRGNDKDGFEVTEYDGKQSVVPCQPGTGGFHSGPLLSRLLEETKERQLG